MTGTVVGPPVTVEDESSGEGYHDEYKPSWNSDRMSRPVSPLVDRVINSFNQELDNLTKSFDDLLSTEYEIRKASVETTPHNRSYYSSYSTAKKSPFSRVRDPPPSAERFSPLRNYVNSTPARRTAQVSASYTAERPPAPVETPGLFPTGTPTTTRTPIRRKRGDSSNEQPRGSPSHHQVQPEDLQYSLTASSDWEDSLNKMRQTLTEQEKLIGDLVRDNKLLRRQLRERSEEEPPAVDGLYQQHSADAERLHLREEPNRQRSSYREDFSAHRDDPGSAPRRSRGESQHRSSYREEPNGRHQASTSSTYRTTPMSTPVRTIRSPPRRIHTSSHMIIPEEEGFTPGVRFVAELAALTKMEQGHHAPLSVILDKHWDKLKHHFSASEDF